jgi:hypothetical protein
MVIVDEKKLNTISQSDHWTLDDESLAHDASLRKSGHFLAAHDLQGVETATTIQAVGGRLSVTDGPLAETNEQIEGFVLVEACDWTKPFHRPRNSCRRASAVSSFER